MALARGETSQVQRLVGPFISNSHSHSRSSSSSSLKVHHVVVLMRRSKRGAGASTQAEGGRLGEGGGQQRQVEGGSSSPTMHGKRLINPRWLTTIGKTGPSRRWGCSDVPVVNSLIMILEMGEFSFLNNLS